jgi:membrane-associated phospholipid phosphatase
MNPPTFATAGSPGPLNNRHDFLVVNDWARHTGWLHGAMKLYASDGVALFAVFLILGWWIARRRNDPRRMATALWAGIGTIVAVGVNQPIVNGVKENRPYVTLHHTLLLVSRSTDYSFPSDHATMAGAVAAGLLLVAWRLGLLALLAALLIAFARVYIGAHYPGDVLAGLAVGAVVVLVGYLIVVPLLTRLIAHLSATRLRPFLAASPPQGPGPSSTADPRTAYV